jgi:transcriptional antiterminator RfaH
MWALATVKPNTEPSIERALIRQGVPFHVFRYQAKILRRRRIITILRPLFPRYVFVAFDFAWSICHLDNVIGLVCFGGNVAVVSSVLVDGLVQSGVGDVLPVQDTTAAITPKYQRGDRIIAIVGLLVGHLGMVVRPLASGRVRCEFELTGKRIIVDLPPLELRLVERKNVAKKKRRRYRRIRDNATADHRHKSGEGLKSSRSPEFAETCHA